MRRSGGFELEREELPMDVVWCKLPPAPGPKGERAAYFSVEGGHLFISYIAPDGLLQVAWVILKGSYAELKRQGVEQWVGQMARFAPVELADHLRANAERFVHPFLLDTAANRVRRWSAPGALLLGDAAHTMSPVGGQGVNTRCATRWSRPITWCRSSHAAAIRARSTPQPLRSKRNGSPR